MSGHPTPVNRWALRLDQPPANPGAGQPIGQPHKAGGHTVNGSNASQWHPTVVSLLVLIVLEILAYGVLRWAFRTAHGG